MCAVCVPARVEIRSAALWTGRWGWGIIRPCAAPRLPTLPPRPSHPSLPRPLQLLPPIPLSRPWFPLALCFPTTQVDSQGGKGQAGEHQQREQQQEATTAVQRAAARLGTQWWWQDAQQFIPWLCLLSQVGVQQACGADGWGIRKVVGVLAFLSPPLPPLPPLCRSLMDSTWCRRTSCTWLGASGALILGLSIGAMVSAGSDRVDSASGSPPSFS